MANLHRSLLTMSVLAAALPATAQAQTLAYGDVDGPDKGAIADAPQDSARDSGEHSRGAPRRGSSYGVKIAPYIEAAQVATAELSPGNDILTYSRVAAGIEASVAGRNNGASVSLRYEHYFGWGKQAGDGDTISGLARGYATITPGLQIEAGALASRTTVSGNGSAAIGSVGPSSAASQVYSVYAGPTVSTHAGDVKIDGGYRIGYTRLEAPDSLVTAPGQAALDVFDDSVTQNATVHAGVKPGDVLPVGIGVGAGYYREDISNLDQRVSDFSARADVMIPVSPNIALVGGVGYEDVQISSRDALRGPGGLPVIGSDGRYVTDTSQPRKIAFDTSGLIWDAGVIWRPSRRTALEAHVGKRFGSTSYYGSFAFAPNKRSSFNVSAYDNVAGFGGQVTRALADLPVEFRANRNILTGDITGCAESAQDGACLTGVLGSVRSSTFRARGVTASYNLSLGAISAGIGAGYDRRKFIAAQGTVLAAANGVVDENTWLAAYLNARVSARGTLSTNVYANWFETGAGFGGDTTTLGATAAYGHAITDHLSATAAVGIDGIQREDPLVDVWSASALLGVRYTF